MAWDDDLFARIGDSYDLVFAGEVAQTLTQADFAAHTLALRPGQRLLDLCCGPGRHAVALALRGVAVTGVERDARLIALARERARARGVEVQWVQGDARHLPRLRPFHAAICLFSSWGYAEDPTENEAVLCGVAQRLAPGGRFLIDVPNLLWLQAHPRGEHFSIAGGVGVHEVRRFDADRRELTARWHIHLPGRPAWRAHVQYRVYGLADLEWLLARAGLVLEAAFGDFAGGPLSGDQPRCLALARRPVLPPGRPDGAGGRG